MDPSTPLSNTARSSSGVPIVGMLEAKTHLCRLVGALETGALAELLIARNGRPVARLSPLKGPGDHRRIGAARGGFALPGDA